MGRRSGVEGEGDGLPLGARLSEAPFIDLEALAFRDGALFLGFKAPLDDHGRAALLRVEHLTTCFDTQKLTAQCSIAGRTPRSGFSPRCPDLRGSARP